MSGKSDGFTVKKRAETIDLTELLKSLIRATAKLDEKSMLNWLLLRLSAQQVGLVETLTQPFVGLDKQVAQFFQSRVEDYRKALRVGKLFGFRSWASIETEAVERAWQDTRTFIRETAPTHDPTLCAIVDDHRELLRRLCHGLLALILEQGNAGIQVNHGALQRLLEGNER